MPQQPPYSERDIPENGLVCFLCKEFAATNFGSILTHLKQKHKYPNKTWKGTFLYEQGNKCIAHRDRIRYQKVAPPRQRQANAVKREVGGDSIGGGAAAVADRKMTKPDGSTWALYWVRVGEDDAPLLPVELESLPSGASQSRSSAPTVASQSSVGTQPAETPPRDDVWGESAQIPKWRQDLPHIRIKNTYIVLQPPVPSAHGGRTSGWPVQLQVVDTDLSGFRQYLHSQKAFKSAAQDECIRSMSRVFDMLESDSFDIARRANDPTTLVAIIVDNIHQALFELPLLAPEYTWTGNIISALKTFSDYQLSAIRKQKSLSGHPRWQSFQDCIHQLQEDLQGGPTKRITQERKRRHNERRAIDAERINNFAPLEAFKAAVVQGMLRLKHICDDFEGHRSLPVAAQAQASACMVGIVYLNGFGGRKLEWELMTMKHVVHQLEDELDYMVCEKHKTAHVYGSLSKRIAPGTRTAMKLYLGLPRNTTSTKFLARADGSADTISLPNYLRRFCEAFLPKTATHTTVNLLRKWYHTRLAQVSRTEDGLMNLFRTVDGHSAAVAQKHYNLKTPADDAQLAKALVYAMLGSPVAWPAEQEIADPSSRLALDAALLDNTDFDDKGDAPDAEDADEELDYFEGAQIFGINPPLVALVDEDLRDSPTPTDGPPHKSPKELWWHGKHHRAALGMSSSPSSPATAAASLCHQMPTHRRSSTPERGAASSQI